MSICQVTLKKQGTKLNSKCVCVWVSVPWVYAKKWGKNPTHGKQVLDVTTRLLHYKKIYLLGLRHIEKLIAKTLD